MLALSGHLHDAEWGNGQDMAFSFIFGHFLFHAIEDGLAISAAFHVDEVEDEEPSDVTELDLACNFACGFDVSLNDVVFSVFAGAAVGAGVDVDCGECFGFFDNDFST